MKRQLYKFLDKLSSPSEYYLFYLSVNDWRRLGELSGLEDLEIRNMQQSSSNPTEAVLIRAISKGCTVGKFLEYLREMERYDVIEDCRKIIGE